MSTNQNRGRKEPKAGLRAKLARFGRADDGLATTETVILTAFLVVVATVGGAILLRAVTAHETVITPVVVTTAAPTN